MQSNLFVTGLTIALGLATPIVSAIGFPEAAVAQTVDQRKVEADRLFEQGIQQLKTNQITESSQSFKQALQIYRQLENVYGTSNTLRHLEIAYKRLNNHSEAIKYRYQLLTYLYENLTSLRKSTKLQEDEFNQRLQEDRLKLLNEKPYGAIVYYLVRADKTHIGLITIDENKKDLYYASSCLIKESLLTKFIDNFNFQLKKKEDIQTLNFNSQEIYNCLIKPIEPQLNNLFIQAQRAKQKPNLIISADAKIHSLPIEALYNRGNYLINNFDILRIANISSELELNKDIDELEKLSTWYQTQNDQSGEAKTLAEIGEFYSQAEQFDLAILSYKKSVNLTQMIRGIFDVFPLTFQESYIQSIAGRYRRLADLLLSQGRIGEAQKVLELLKVQELNDITEGSRSPSPQQNQVALSKVEEQIIQKHTSLIQFGQQLSECKKDTCAKLDEYKATYRQLTVAYDKFIEDLKTQLVADRDKSIAATTDDFIGGASKIVNTQPNTVLIYSLVLKDKTRILWASKGGILSQAECPIGEAQLSTLVKDFRTALQTSDDLNPVQKTGQLLYNCLLPQKLRDELTKNKIDNLVFVPDRVTNYIPMAALHDGNNYLIETYSVANILAASYTDTDDRLPKAPTILGFGLSQSVKLSNPTRQFSPLPFVPTELDAIIQPPNNPQKGIFPGQQWLDRDFTLDRLTTGLLDKPNILHIATHGEFVATDPKASYLVLGDSTPYALSQVEYLRNLSNIHLVVLSACETALGGRDRNGLEVAGISAYFLGDPSRAKSVLASLWKVNDPATSILMSEFYKTLHQNNLSKSQSLRKVQREMIASKLTLQDAANRAGVRLYEPNKKRPQNLSHPYYWAPFILIGNSQ